MRCGGGLTAELTGHATGALAPHARLLNDRMTETALQEALAALQADGMRPHAEGGLRWRYRKYATPKRLTNCIRAVVAVRHPLNLTHNKRADALKRALEMAFDADPEAKSERWDEELRLDPDEIELIGSDMRLTVGITVIGVIQWATARQWDRLEAT